MTPAPGIDIRHGTTRPGWELFLAASDGYAHRVLMFTAQSFTAGRRFRSCFGTRPPGRSWWPGAVLSADRPMSVIDGAIARSPASRRCPGPGSYG